MLVYHITELDGILITHEHYDHVAGLDDIRPLGSMNVYGQERVLDTIRNNMPYSFAHYKMPLNVPDIVLHKIDAELFAVKGLVFEPIQLMHFKLPILGFRTGGVAYLTDFNGIPEAEFGKLANLEVLVIDALRVKPHPSHNSLEQALALVEKIKPRRAYFTHISHGMGLHEEVQKSLPENVFLAYDGLEVAVGAPLNPR
jgi:phosphoribosyl 1,2-cyclic phosphate phosphodiesterase